MTALLRTDNDGVAEIVLHRPQSRNALTTDLLAELRAHLDQIRDSPDVRAVVLAGDGDVFCAGADLREFPPDGGPSDGPLRRVRLVSEVLRQLSVLEQPTVAVVHGAAIGAGWGLALACDLCVAAETTLFSLPEVAKGFRLPPAIPARLAQLAGTGRATEIVLGGQPQPASRGVAEGWLSRVLPDQSSALEHARGFARATAKHPRPAVSSAKSAIRGIPISFVWQEK